MTNVTSLVGIWVALGLLVSFLIWKWPDQYVHLIFCDVGQGDAIIVAEGHNQIVIDTGPDQAVLECLGQYLPFWDRTIELLVLTHPDQDHIGGATEVLDRYTVQKILIPAYGKPTQEFTLLRKSIVNEQLVGAELFEPFLGQKIVLSSRVDAQVLWPQQPFSQMSPSGEGGNRNIFDPEIAETQLSAYLSAFEHKIENYNDGSIVLLLRMGTVLALLTGDLEKNGEQALLAQGLIPDVDVLKVGHHGSNTSSTHTFIATLTPETAVISSGRNNRYRHPHPEVLATLEGSGSTLVRTDQVGTIELISDGTRYWLAE